MQKRVPVVFKRSLLAAAVISMSACSSMPSMPDVDLSPVGNGIAKAGRATANVGRSAWNNTAYLLGFRDSRDNVAQNPSDDQLLIASNDPTSGETLEIAPLEENRIPSDRPLAVQHSGDNAQVATASAESATDSAPSGQDLIHEVTKNETLWDIAKKTTGDATNWHSLADINNLQQNAAVYPGQKLLIPSKMVKPGYDPDATDIIATATNDATSDVSDSEVIEVAATAAPIAADQSLSDSSDAEALAAAPAEQDSVTIDLQERETLWDFAKRTTGDATNWKQIALHNDFTEKQATTVRPGQSIQVPSNLLRDSTQEVASSEPAEIVILDDSESAVAAADEAASELVENAETSLAAALPEVQEQAAEASESLAEAASSEDAEALKIVEANYQTDESLNTETLTGGVAQVTDSANIPSEITVKGTYYPKAVYNDADFSSSLLMRVSPGTQLQVSRAMGTWFEVETEKGVGYVHSRDIQ